MHERDPRAIALTDQVVRYAVERALGMPIGSVNVRVQGLRMN